MIGQLLPPSVQIGEAFADRPDVVLYPQESAVIVRAVEQRRREFATVRGRAREALSALGVESVPIVPGLWGAPIWPPGVVGSMTHCPGYRGAAVARSTDFSSVGIDAEVDQPLPRRLIDKIMRPEEHVWLAELDNCGVCPDRLLFCVKETIYKTWFPLTHRYFGFDEACATLHRNGTFTAVVRLPTQQRRVRGPRPSVAGGSPGTAWCSVLAASRRAGELRRDGLIVETPSCSSAFRMRASTSRRISPCPRSLIHSAVNARAAAACETPEVRLRVPRPARCSLSLPPTVAPRTGLYQPVHRSGRVTPDPNPSPLMGAVVASVKIVSRCIEPHVSMSRASPRRAVIDKSLHHRAAHRFASARSMDEVRKGGAKRPAPEVVRGESGRTILPALTGRLGLSRRCRIGVVVPGWWPRRSCSRAGAVECVEGGVVGVGEGVQVFLGGAQAAVAEAFFDGLDVGAAGEQPGGVGVAQVVERGRNGRGGRPLWRGSRCGGGTSCGGGGRRCRCGRCGCRGGCLCRRRGVAPERGLERDLARLVVVNPTTSSCEPAPKY